MRRVCPGCRTLQSFARGTLIGQWVPRPHIDARTQEVCDGKPPAADPVEAERDRYKALYEDAAGELLRVTSEVETALSRARTAEQQAEYLRRRVNEATAGLLEARAEVDALKARDRTVLDDLRDAVEGLTSLQRSAVARWEADREAVRARGGVPGDYTVWEQQDMNGRPFLADIVVARANALATLATLTKGGGGDDGEHECGGDC